MKGQLGGGKKNISFADVVAADERVSKAREELHDAQVMLIHHISLVASMDPQRDAAAVRFYKDCVERTGTQLQQALETLAHCVTTIHDAANGRPDGAGRIRGNSGKRKTAAG